MLKLSKIVFLVVVIAFIVNCTKNKDEKKVGVVDSSNSVKVMDAHDHSHTKELKDGDLPIDPVASKVASFSMDGKYDEAIKVLLEAKDVPGYQWDAKRLYDSIIYLYNKTEQYEKNLDIWRDGHNKGLIFNMDITKPHFKPYLELEGFDDILMKDIDLRQEKNNLK